MVNSKYETILYCIGLYLKYILSHTLRTVGIRRNCGILKNTFKGFGTKKGDFEQNQFGKGNTMLFKSTDMCNGQ